MWVVLTMLVFVCCCAVDRVFWTVPSLKSKKQVSEMSLRSLPHCKSMMSICDIFLAFSVNFVVFQANILHLEQAFFEAWQHWYQSEVVVHIKQTTMPGKDIKNQQSTMTNLCGEELPLLFRRLDVGSLSEGIAFESRRIGGRRAADTTLGHTDSDLREVQKTRKTEISKRKPQRWMEILGRGKWLSNELDVAVRRTIRALKCRESKLDHKLQNIIQCQLEKCVDEIEVHSTCWEPFWNQISFRLSY